MGIHGESSGAAAMLAVVVLAVMVAGGRGQQSGTQSCVANLVPCQLYLNSTSPPESCCGPLKEAVTNQLPCLCALYASPNVLKAFNIDLAQALLLPVHCGLSADTSACSNSSASSPGGSPSPPATPGGKNNAARGAARMGMSSLTILSLFWWSVMA